MPRNLFKAAAMMALSSWIAVCSPSLHAGAASSANNLTHCTWGDFGCTNPPPAVKPPVKANLVGKPGNARLACDPVLSTGSECWTNCKTEEEITICDIIKLDTFMPEGPIGGLTRLKSGNQVTQAKTVTKVYSGNRTAKGRFVN